MPAHLIAEEGPQRGLVLDLSEDGDWVIGRDPDEADFVLEDHTVSRKAARLTKTEGAVLVKNLSRTNPTQLNGEPLTTLASLKEGDRLQIGHTVFLFSEEEIPSIEKKVGKGSGYDTIFEDVSQEIPFKEDTNLLDSSLKQPEEGSRAAYDTIFEDSREEAEVPFHLLPESPYILKVVAGPNAGAEIGVEKGKSYVIGKDPNTCDIVFQDMSVSRHHARLTVNEDGSILLEDLESKNGTLVNSEEIREPKSVKSYDLISLGTTAFYILDQDEPQETLYSPLSGEEDLIEPSVEEAEALAEVALKEKEESDWRKAKIPGKHLITVGAAAVIFLIIFLSFFALFKAKGVEIAHIQPAKEIEKILSKYKDVQYSYNSASGKLFLVGHVLTSVDYTEMNYSLGQVEGLFDIEDTVIIDELVSKSMNDVLATNAAWASVSIRAKEAGIFTVTGYLPTSADSAELSDYLNINFPYLDRLRYNVVTEDVLTSQLDGLLGVAGFGGVELQLSNGDVILSGRYNEKKEKEMQNFIQEVNKLPGVVRVRNFAVPSHPMLAALDITNQFQVGGIAEHDGAGYSVVLNGKLYTIGQNVNGMKLTNIEANTILLEKDGLKYKIDYIR